MYTSKYDFYDVVIIKSTKSQLKKVNGYLGVIRGKSQSEEDPNVYAYAVDVLGFSGMVIDGLFIFEEDLVPTGKKANPLDFKNGDVIKVQVDLNTGDGKTPNET